MINSSNPLNVDFSILGGLFRVGQLCPVAHCLRSLLFLQVRYFLLYNGFTIRYLLSGCSALQLPYQPSNLLWFNHKKARKEVV